MTVGGLNAAICDMYRFYHVFCCCYVNVTTCRLTNSDYIFSKDELILCVILCFVQLPLKY